MPAAGVSIDRRAFKHLAAVYNDDRIRGLICIVCNQVHTDTGGKNTAIKYKDAGWLAALHSTNPDAFALNFCLETFLSRYGQGLADAPGN